MNTILLTGFKPFSSHVVNDSETCVNIIKNTDIEEELNVKLVTEILDVCYNTALERINDLWAEHNPFIAIHLGVHNKDTIRIEKCARKIGYKIKDTRGTCPLCETCPLGQQEILATHLNINELVKKCSRGSYIVDYSENAGLFLCEYVYYISLCQDPSRVLFIHVPPYKENSSPREKALIIKDIIKEAYLQRSIALSGTTNT